MDTTAKIKLLEERFQKLSSDEKYSQNPSHKPLCYKGVVPILRHFLPLGVLYALCLFHVLYDPVGAFLCLPVDISKADVQFAIL